MISRKDGGLVSFAWFRVVVGSEGQKIGSSLMLIEGLFPLPASIRAQIIVKGIHRNETATIKTVRKKPLRH